jgi:hypothetical protein
MKTFELWVHRVIIASLVFYLWAQQIFHEPDKQKTSVVCQNMTVEDAAGKSRLFLGNLECLGFGFPQSYGVAILDQKSKPVGVFCSSLKQDSALLCFLTNGTLMMKLSAPTKDESSLSFSSAAGSMADFGVNDVRGSYVLLTTPGNGNLTRSLQTKESLTP